jgi:beta-N-acetylhexosaminidase
MTDLLRGELGFQGIILTDALCMNGFTSWGSYEDRILASFNGGTDVFLWPETERFFELMKAALHDGRASMERLEESVERVMCFKAWLDLTSEKYELTDAALQANSAISEKVAEQSLTLLRNRANHLPLEPSDGAEILMLVLPGTEQAMKPLQCFKGEFEKRGFQVTLSGFPVWSEFDTMLDLKKFQWVFLICNCRPLYVQWPTYNNYGFWNFMLHKDIGKRILFSFGTPYFLYEITEADTYINSYSDSESSQKALVKALFGEIPFAGRSPVSMKHCFNFAEGQDS